MPRTDIARRVYNHAWKLDPIVRSLLDTDFYKLLMLQMIWGLYPKVEATFSLINRKKTVRLADEIDEQELRAQLAQQADPAPDLDTVELKDLLDAVRCFLEDGQAIVIRAESDSVTIQALNEAQFVCSTADARDVLDHATALGLYLVMF